MSHVFKLYLRSWKSGYFVSRSPKSSLEGAGSVKNLFVRNPDFVSQLSKVRTSLNESKIDYISLDPIISEFYNVIRKIEIDMKLVLCFLSKRN